MDSDNTEPSTEELVRRLAAADAADAPEIADRIAEQVAAALDPAGAPDEEPA